MSFRSFGAQLLSPTTTAIKTLSFARVPEFAAVSQVIIQPETTAIRWTDDPEFALSSTAGMVLAAGDTLVFQGDWANLRIIADSGTPSVWCYLYGGGG